ncbi:hypothetical protein PF005_g24470 [Phytophthora fragariae]|uniref:RxLR effector protein n=2 Tax=Phytophthora TaxID=4783 RepID=A0A6A3QG16_9STRA|nr:hypothetical protein PF003_g11186 [Phytophthora fragariae]KAE8987218.1 hypothetical protein PR002_g22111 [Phytophthora rubi]KAE8925343.1 hypothetical protein PF009_g24446 [Phytophthora fragariae]KAE8977248.1 hypothetical protein PF011_g23725 [Phytophthora fragariae]KAE8989603.1 hypothetical protein PR001_g21735 [Phytophthora rubi]
MIAENLIALAIALVLLWTQDLRFTDCGTLRANAAITGRPGTGKRDTPSATARRAPRVR